MLDRSINWINPMLDQSKQHWISPMGRADGRTGGGTGRRMELVNAGRPPREISRLFVDLSAQTAEAKQELLKHSRHLRHQTRKA